MVRRVVLDKKTNKISITNTFVAVESELEFKAEVLGISTDDELLERIKESGGINKFKVMAEEALRQSRKRS